MNLNLFDMEGLSLQQESYLDETFGLSADILAADLDTDGSILDLGLGPGHMEGNKLPSLQQPSGSLDDLFTDGGGSFGEEWMETVDLGSLLDNNNLLGQVPAQAVDAAPEPPKPVVTTISSPEPEPRKEGMKASAFELLKALLTGAVADTTTIKIESSPVPQSPEAEVPDMSLLADSFIDSVNSPDASMESSLEDLLDIQQENSTPNDSAVEVKPEITLFDMTGKDSTGLALPLDCSDIESILSSGPSSPENSISLFTIDSSQLSDTSIQSSVDKSSQITDSDFVATKTKKSSKSKEKSRMSPYEAEPVYDKKGRKKEQNKNAATRYRVKKRQEKESLQQQEGHLLDKNKSLKEKVESLQREIQYMKELMNEIYKAKKSNI